MDPNFLQNLRMNNIYGGTTDPTYTSPYTDLNDSPFIPPPTPPASVPATDSGNTGDISSLMSTLYQPEHTSIDKFNQLVNSFPQQNEPSTLRKIGAAALGTLADLPSKFGPHGVINPSAPPTGAGQFAFDEMTGKIPYQEAVSKWQAQVQPVEQAANIERENNSNARMMAYQTASAQLRQQAQDEKAKNDDVKSQIAQQRANVYQLMSENKDDKIVMQKGGNVFLVHNGQMQDTGTPTNTLSDIDTINIKHHNDMIDIEAKTAGAEAVAGVKGNEARTTKAAPSAPKPESQGDVAKQRYNTAKQIHDTDPELGKFIQLGPGTNDFSITPSGTNWLGNPTGPTPEQFKKLNDTIYSSSDKNNNTPPVQTAPPAPKGWRYIPKAGGGWTAVPDTGGGGQ